jgi:hypothetical protein
MQEIFALIAWLISHQPAVLFSHNKSATSNQPAVLFSQNKPAPAISHQSNEQADSSATVNARSAKGMYNPQTAGRLHNLEPIIQTNVQTAHTTHRHRVRL